MYRPILSSPQLEVCVNVIIFSIEKDGSEYFSMVKSKVLRRTRIISRDLRSPQLPSSLCILVHLLSLIFLPHLKSASAYINDKSSTLTYPIMFTPRCPESLRWYKNWKKWKKDVCLKFGEISATIVSHYQMSFISAKAQGENISRIMSDGRQGSKGSQMSILVELQIHRSQGGIKFPSDEYSLNIPLLDEKTSVNATSQERRYFWWYHAGHDWVAIANDNFCTSGITNNLPSLALKL